jgi:predicted anti-sigma-YlaC factor YlaD
VTAICGRRFDEELLSGYLDGMLTQRERQQVVLHLEGCADCRGELAELATVREAARGSAFVAPPDEQWQELPKTPGSRSLRFSGWLLLAVWVTVVAVFALVELARSTAPAWERLAVVGVGAGLVLLLLSALLDRVHELRHDRYRRVQK